MGQGTITTIAPEDMIQCAIDCSTYCRVLPVNSGRLGSAWEKQADSPILRRREAGGDMATGTAGMAMLGFVTASPGFVM